MFDTSIHQLAYRLVAFTTKKGTFTLIGTDHNWTDTFLHLETRNRHEWSRHQIRNWFLEGKIKPVEHATGLDWFRMDGNKGRIDLNGKVNKTYTKKRK